MDTGYIPGDEQCRPWKLAIIVAVLERINVCLKKAVIAVLEQSINKKSWKGAVVALLERSNGCFVSHE
jgi:hypothetical protein